MTPGVLYSNAMEQLYQAHDLLDSWIYNPDGGLMIGQVVGTATESATQFMVVEDCDGEQERMTPNEILMRVNDDTWGFRVYDSQPVTGGA